MLSFRRVRSIRTPRQTGLALRAMAAVVVWLAALGHLGGLAHFVLVSHHVCAAHGELTHAGEGEHAHAATSPRGASRIDPAATVAPSSEDAHEHCSMLARRQEQASLERPSDAVLAPPAPEARSELRAEVLPKRGDTLLALAPKTSPPV